MPSKYFNENIGGPLGKYWALWVALGSGLWCPVVSLFLSLSLVVCVVCLGDIWICNNKERRLLNLNIVQRVSAVETQP